MKLLLDTSYFFPYFNIMIEKLPDAFLLMLLNNSKYSILISEISFIELTAKCMKLCFTPKYQSILNLPGIIRGNDSIRFDTRISTISWLNNPKIQEFAYELRKIHTDFFDCIIVATALVIADAFGTFDEPLYNKIKQTPDLCNKIKKINPHFEFKFYAFEQKSKTL